MAPEDLLHETLICGSAGGPITHVGPEDDAEGAEGGPWQFMIKLPEPPGLILTLEVFTLQL